MAACNPSASVCHDSCITDLLYAWEGARVCILWLCAWVQCQAFTARTHANVITPTSIWYTRLNDEHELNNQERGGKIVIQTLDNSNLIWCQQLDVQTHSESSNELWLIESTCQDKCLIFQHRETTACNWNFIFFTVAYIFSARSTALMHMSLTATTNML